MKTLKETLGMDVIPSRFGEIDIAYPASEEEYCTLGGYAIIMIIAISDTQKELPIERAYFQFRDKKIEPLANLGISFGGGDFLANQVKETKDDKGRVYSENVSFWAMRSGFLIDQGGLIAIDFKGERKGFDLLRGPWENNSRVMGWLEKRRTGQIQVAEHVPYDLIAQFIEREFVQNNRVQL